MGTRVLGVAPSLNGPLALARLGEAIFVGLLAAAVFVVHDVPYLLDHPFWLDESWVAISTRAPLGELPRITSSTPLGWTMLLRAVPDVGEQSLRLLPLSFSAATVVVAYLFGRELRLLGPCDHARLAIGQPEHARVSVTVATAGTDWTLGALRWRVLGPTHAFHGQEGRACFLVSLSIRAVAERMRGARSQI